MQTGILTLINNIRNSTNPQETFSQLMNNNPQLQQVMNYVQQNGGDAKAAFYNLAKEKGIDPNTILSQLR